MPQQAKLFRDASGRLILDLDRDYPAREVDARAVRTALAEQFGATLGDRFDDPLGDAAAVAFTSRGEGFQLWWDHWLGLCVVSLQPSGDAKLQEMAEYFDAHRLPLLVAE